MKLVDSYKNGYKEFAVYKNKLYTFIYRSAEGYILLTNNQDSIKMGFCWNDRRKKYSLIVKKENLSLAFMLEIHFMYKEVEFDIGGRVGENVTFMTSDENVLKLNEPTLCQFDRHDYSIILREKDVTISRVKKIILW